MEHLHEVLALINGTRTIFRKKLLDAMPQGKRYDASCCALQRALADCRVTSVGITGVRVSAKASARKLAKFWGTEMRKTHAYPHEFFIVDLPPVLSEFRKNFDYGKYRELILP